MSHLIESMFSVKETPWHQLGHVLDEAPTIEEAISLAGMGFNVNKVPTFYNVPSSTVSLPTGHFVTVRDDTNESIGNVGARYEVLQNVDAFKPFEVIMDYGYTIETAGVIENGKKVWILAKTPSEYLIGDDKVLDFILMYTSHDGSTGSCFRDVQIRVVCNNTLQASLKGNYKFEYKLRHTSSINQRVQDLARNIENRDGNIKLAVDKMNKMHDTPMDEKMLEMYIESVMPFLKNRHLTSNPEIGVYRKNKALPVFNTIKQLFYTGQGNKGKTVWDGYNAITEYHDHRKSHKDWVKGTQFGSSYKYKKDAFEVATKISETSLKYVVGGIN